MNVLGFLVEVVADPVREGCRDYPSEVGSERHPCIEWGGVTIPISHVVLELDGRPRPPGAYALHSCDRGRCIAPWHLSWGTQSQNIAEAYMRGRRAALLTAEDVVAIRASAESGPVLARRYGVTRQAVWKVRHGRTGAWVPDPEPIAR